MSWSELWSLNQRILIDEDSFSWSPARYVFCWTYSLCPITCLVWSSPTTWPWTCSPYRSQFVSVRFSSVPSFITSFISSFSNLVYTSSVLFFFFYIFFWFFAPCVPRTNRVHLRSAVRSRALRARTCASISLTRASPSHQTPVHVPLFGHSLAYYRLTFHSRDPHPTDSSVSQMRKSRLRLSAHSSLLDWYCMLLRLWTWI